MPYTILYSYNMIVGSRQINPFLDLPVVNLPLCKIKCQQLNFRYMVNFNFHLAVTILL